MIMWLSIAGMVIGSLILGYLGFKWVESQVERENSEEFDND